MSPSTTRSVTVPDDASLPGVTFAEPEAKRAAAETTVGTLVGGNGAGPLPDGQPGLYGVADRSTSDEAASGAGRAVCCSNRTRRRAW